MNGSGNSSKMDSAGWQGGPPQNLDQLFKFYHEYVKPLYAELQVENTMPQEVLFELNATLDHLSRHWYYSENEASVVLKSYGHLKRACLDVFKLRMKRASDQYRELLKSNIDIIDNGTFKSRLNERFREIRVLGTRARKSEGQPDTEVSVPAFPLWEIVWVKCVELEEEFYQSAHVSWARHRGLMSLIKTQWIGLVVGILASLVAALIYEFFHKN